MPDLNRVTTTTITTTTTTTSRGLGVSPVWVKTMK